MTTKKTISLEEIMAELSEIARNGEGTAKLQALRALMAVEGGNVTVPAPLNDEEGIETMAMLMEAFGKVGTEFAYRRAFPHAHKPVSHASPTIKINHLNLDDSVLPETLPQFYNMFPEVKRGGFPPGFPKGRSVELKKKWIQTEARKILMDRKQAELDAAAAQDKAADEESNAGSD